MASMRTALLLLSVLLLATFHPAGKAALGGQAMDHGAAVSGQAGHHTAGLREQAESGGACCPGMAAGQAGDAQCPADCAGLVPIMAVMPPATGPAANRESAPAASSLVQQAPLRPPIPA
ncbi:hypothetical protein ACLB6G_04550 [Zhengella sp. ZM62]|uniref:hypothetical protein n=1 Tax=Zhengella sedimenti TaxID=3390035 RepID=UPI0039756E04